MALELGATNGIFLVVDPYGRIVAESGINERTVISVESNLAWKGVPMK